ncbi:ATP-binding SpoIIE family protein phosphatase [Yinghuangia soli]|uniref:protein-serine/threonine phosphatase n=1 Tax=Yinghuangia soli TaxID=2908204 RepID=A0AA41Q6R4_9ACTN|nr:SpoIIE family protein phosphatase [Yinghuangia soli]MCF2532237.1 SpoIIE family protein phosphatase [Yinghuangia soli]
MFDLANLTPSDLVVCGSDLRQATASAETASDAAFALARHLRGTFADPGTGTAQVSLVRVYATARTVGGSGVPGRVLELLSGDGDFIPAPGHPGHMELLTLSGEGAGSPAPLHPALEAVLRDLGVIESPAPGPPGSGDEEGGGQDDGPGPRPGPHADPHAGQEPELPVPLPDSAPASGESAGGSRSGAPAAVAPSAPFAVAEATGATGATGLAGLTGIGGTAAETAGTDAPTGTVPAPPVPPASPSPASPPGAAGAGSSFGAGGVPGAVPGAVPGVPVLPVLPEPAGLLVPDPPGSGPFASVAAAAAVAALAADPAGAMVTGVTGATGVAVTGAGAAFDPDAEPERHAIAHIPDQLAVHHGIRTVLGFAGTLPDGELFAVLLFTGFHIPPAAAELLRGLTAATRLALLPAPATPVPTPRNGQLTAARLDALEQLLAATEDTTVEQARTVETYRGRVRTQAEQLRLKQRRLEQETHIVEVLYNVGQQLTRELDLDQLVQVATDAATTVIAAEHGLLLYRDADTDGPGEIGEDISHAAAVRGGTAHPLLPDPAVRLTGAHLASDVVRCGDVAEHPGRWHQAPVAEDPAALPVRSYLCVPVVNRDGEALGSFAFAHSKPDIFTERDEQLALGIAAQAAAAIENARLYRSVRDTAVRLQRSLLPPELPDIDTLEIACRYLPGARGSQVGGDWFDVIPLSAGRVALVIGDVMGRGLAAAAVMGQLRTAVRAYAVMDLPPAQVMRHLNRLMGGMGGEDQITTCVYAVYDPGHDSIRWSNAGHLPPALISASGEVRLLDDDLGVPLGVDGTMFEDAEVVFGASDRLLLYTDGLVERHDVSLTERLHLFTAAMGGVALNPDGVQDTCDRLLGGMLTGREHDDVALLLVRAQAGRERAAALELPPTPRAAREAREFVRSVLLGWRLGALVDGACSVATELVANAVEHARTPMELRLRHRPGRLVVQVADHDGRLPRRLSAGEGDERHRGLMIVAALAADWGVRPTDAGKVVWAELADHG